MGDERCGEEDTKPKKKDLFNRTLLLKTSHRSESRCSSKWTAWKRLKQKQNELLRRGGTKSEREHHPIKRDQSPRFQLPSRLEKRIKQDRIPIDQKDSGVAEKRSCEKTFMARHSVGRWLAEYSSIERCASPTRVHRGRILERFKSGCSNTSQIVEKKWNH